MPTRIQSTLLVALVLMTPMAPRLAAEPVCAAAPVGVKGEPSRFVWLAKTKAHGNWRAAVRAMADLGPDYANWRKAAEAKDDCSEKNGAYVCTFTGIPCKP